MKPPILRQSPPAGAGRRPRLGLLDRYLLTELAASFLAATVVLLIVMVSGAVADMLARVARGRLPADLLFTLVALRTVGALGLLLPLAALLGVLMAWGRLWRDSEMAVLQSSGFTLRGQLRPLLLFLFPATVVLAAVSFWLAPAAERLSQDLVTEANRSLLVAGLQPGRFVGLPGRDGVIQVGEMSADGTEFKRLFIESEQPDQGRVRINVITAAQGRLYHDADGQGRYIALEDGFRVEGFLGQDDFRVMRFERNDIRLPDTETMASDAARLRAEPSSVLLAARAEGPARAELHWRLAGPVSALVLGLLAVPLARSSPREPRHARLLLALLAWLVYYNLLLLGRGWIESGALPPGMGLWWVHLPVLALAAWLLRGGEALPAPQRVAGAES